MATKSKMTAAEIRAYLEQKRGAWRESDAAPDGRPPLAGSSALDYLNQHWVFEIDAAPAGPGPLAALRVRAKRLATRVVRGALSSFVLQERQFLEHLVRLQNELAERLDRDARELERVAAALTELRAEMRHAVGDGRALHHRIDTCLSLLESEIGRRRV